MFTHPFLKKDFEAREQFLKDGTHLERLLDSTLLKPGFTAQDVKVLCKEARDLKVRAVCLPPSALNAANSWLGSGNGESLTQNSPVVSAEEGLHLCTVVGFPFGFQTTEVKSYEIKQALAAGAVEIDFVQNISLIKDQAWTEAIREMRAVVDASQRALVKVILETSLLSPDEIARCCEISYEAGVHVIKTSTGFGSRGASLQDIEIISETLSRLEKRYGKKLGIKASGGVRSWEDAQVLIKAGATRIGTSQAKLLLVG